MPLGQRFNFSCHSFITICFILSSPVTTCVLFLILYILYYLSTTMIRNRIKSISLIFLFRFSLLLRLISDLIFLCRVGLRRNTTKYVTQNLVSNKILIEDRNVEYISHIKNKIMKIGLWETKGSVLLFYIYASL